MKFRYEATDMNIRRSALSACVIATLPNVYDYIHKHRDELMEEKRQKLLAIENQRNQQLHQQHQFQQPQLQQHQPLMFNLNQMQNRTPHQILHLANQQRQQQRHQ